MVGNGIEEAREYLKSYFDKASGDYFEADAMRPVKRKLTAM